MPNDFDATPQIAPECTPAVRHARHDVIAATCASARCGECAALAVVLETDGSTYVAPGALALFGAAQGQVGWLSGGCLEPEIERVARASAQARRIGWMEVDTRDDEDLLSGSSLGCRGRLRIALLPLQAMPGVAAPFDAWLAGRVALAIDLAADGTLSMHAGDASATWRIEAAYDGWPPQSAAWRLRIDAPPEVLVFGAGPETPLLLPLLRDLGWKTTLVERRERWRAHASFADRHVAGSPQDGLQSAAAFDAALVMHHNFELDREALDVLAAHGVPFVGLLGPVRRREDLFRVLPADHRDKLSSRLHSPIGLKLGGQGAEAIALSIAAQLQAWRNGERAE